jgi:hypothetical protein
MSNQEVDDLNLEVQRFHRIADICIVESLPTFKEMTEESRRIYETHISGPLLSVAKYSMTLDETVKKLLVSAQKLLFQNTGTPPPPGYARRAFRKFFYEAHNKIFKM